VTPSPTRPWPPIIDFARAPWWIRLRDVSATIAAWSLLAYFMRDGIAMTVDYFSHPVFTLARTQMPDWAKVWDRAQYFLLVSAGGVLWLALVGFLRRRRLRLAARQTPPPSLALEAHAEIFGLTPGAIERWREMKISTIEFDNASRMILPGKSPVRAEQDGVCTQAGLDAAKNDLK